MDNEISATMVSLRIHYESQVAQSYNIEDALNSLATFMERAKEVKSAELSTKFNSIMLAPKTALWMKFPPQVVLPEDAVKPRNLNSAGQKQTAQGQERRDQGFQQAGTGLGPRNFRGQGQMGGQGQMTGQGHVQRGQGCLSQPNKRKTLQQMVNLLADILQ